MSERNGERLVGLLWALVLMSPGIWSQADSARPTSREIIRLHVPALPPTLNLSLGSTSVGREIHAVVHEALIRRNPETLEFEPGICRDWIVEDSLFLIPDKAGSDEFLRELPSSDRESTQPVVFGRIEERETGYLVSPLSEGNPLREARLIPAAFVERVERGTVFTLRLREKIRWHDGHRFDSGDVLFSWQLYSNPQVNCDSRRFQYSKISHVEVLDEQRIRFFYDAQYFKSVDALASLCLLPSHLYNLRDPDHARHDSLADERALALEINENLHNREWVGLGSHRVVEWDLQWVRAEKFSGYFDANRAGEFDEIWWRALTSDSVLREALSEGVVDFTDRLTPELAMSFEGSGAMAGRYETGTFHRGRYGFLAWNLRRPELSSAKVRRAIAHAFDFNRFNGSQYDGLAVRVTGPQNRFGPGYDQSVKAPAFDLERAEALLTEAGWIDRDQDGVLDREGVDLEIELLLPAGNRSGERVATVLQEGLRGLGIVLTIRQLDLAALLARVRSRDFDSVLLAWTQPLESDPQQKWHSSLANSAGSSNFGGFADPEVDRLIEYGQAELDSAKRFAAWRELHRRLNELQPYLFLFDAPSTYALRSDLDGFKSNPVPPNYNPRDWSQR